MSSAKITKKKPLQKFDSNIVKFQNTNEEIYFPKICIICGTNTENRYKRTVFGRLASNIDYKVNYHVNIPVCKVCKQNIQMKTGISSNSGKSILISSIFSLIIGIILYILTYSTFLSISVFVIQFTFLYIRYKGKMSKKVNLSDFLKIQLGVDKKTLTFDFFNHNYANFVKEINSRKESEENHLKTERN